MKTRLRLVLSMLVLGAPAALAQGTPDAVAVDPTHHQVVLENDHVRVFQVLASPGARSAMHSHHPLVFVSLGRARIRITAPGGSTTIFDTHPAQVLWFQDVVHSWELLSGQLQVIAVEPKAARQGNAPAAVRRAANDPVTVDPTHHHVIMENDHVRVFEVLASPGETSPMHAHSPFALVSLDRVRLRLGLPDGSSAILDLHPGQAVWLENATHSWELLSGQLRVIGVEVKAAAAP
ncbi:MAG: hypothetical protein M3373_08075 [Gemmatimonadota bacterium]|nr:hypothetical protein [Gemmatimonadota bacterium]